MALAAMATPVPFLRDIEKEGRHQDFRAGQGVAAKEKKHIDDRRRELEGESDSDYGSDYSDSSSDDDSSDESDESDYADYADGADGDDEEKSDGEETKELAGAASTLAPLKTRLTYREKIEMWRARKRKARRHPTLVYYEKLLAKEQAKANYLAREREEIAEYNKIKAREKYDKDQQVKEFLLSVQSNDWARYQKMCVQRQKELDNTTQRMRLFERWDLQRGVEEKRERAEAARLATEKAATEAARLAAEAREAKAVAAEASRVADERLTQETLKYMRVAGTIAGVNAPEAEEPGVARETDAALTLRVRPGADAAHPDPAKKDDAKRAPAKEDLRENMDYMVTKDAAGDRKKKNLPFFTVELRRFRNVTTMKGEKLGPTGAKQLVKELVAGACPRLASLDLAWNRIKILGVNALADGFKRKCSPNLSHLDLRANYLTPSAVDELVAALALGGVKLRVLDLRANLLANDGACKVASTALAGGFETLEELCLQNNDIRQRGLFALYQAFTADAKEKLFPNIRVVSARYNKADPATLRRMRPCPPWLAF